MTSVQAKRFPPGTTRARARAFTLVEMLVSLSILALLMGLWSQMFDGTALLITFRNKSMDADTKARDLLGRMALDFGGMVKRTDVSYFLKSGAVEGTAAQNSYAQIPPPSPSNDQIAFYSETPAAAPAVGSSQTTLSIVGYRLNPATYQMERYGKGLYWNGIAASSDEPVYLPALLSTQWPAVASATASDSSYQTLGPPVFRFQYYYLLKSGTLSITPWDAGAGHASLNGLKDVAAIAVVIAAVDDRSRRNIPDATLSALQAQMGNFTSGMAPGALEAQWQQVFESANLAPPVLSALHIYHRYFYLNTN